MNEKPTAIILPSWNPDDPRFVVKNCKHRIAEDREFRNNTCVFNQRLGFAYNVNEIVEVLNSMGDELDKLEKENEQLRKIGVMYQGHNPCEICTYLLEDKVCCAESIPIYCDDAKKNFIQGLCKKHKQFMKSFRRYDDE